MARRKASPEKALRYEMTQMRDMIIKNRGNKCEICGISGKYKKLLVHHKKPVSKGGTNEWSNLQVVCNKCHSRIHNYGLVIRIDRDLYEWLLRYDEKPSKALRHIKGIIDKYEDQISY